MKPRDFRKRLLILDENISCLLDSRLSALGFRVKRLITASGDQYLIREVRRLRAVLVTHDRDFLNISPQGTGGILLIRIPSPQVDSMVQAILNLVQKYSPARWKDKILILSPHGFIIS